MSLTVREPKIQSILKLQSILRAFLAVRAAEKRIKKHILRTKIANELLETELNYLRDVRTIHWEFNSGSGEVLTQQEQATLFMNVGEIAELHRELSKELHEKVKKKWSYHQTVADLLIKYVERFRIYEKYITNYKEAADFLQKSRTQNSKIVKYLEARECNQYCRGLKLESFLVMPVQRLPRYLLLLKELRKHTDSAHPDYALINEAMEKLDGLAKQVNELQRDKETSLKIARIVATVHGADEVSLDSPFVYEGSISLKKIKLSKPGLARSLSFSKGLKKEVWKELYVYLFKDTMLCAKKIGTASTKTILGAIHGKGLYKFSTTKGYALRSSTFLEVSTTDPCTFKLVTEKETSEFRTATPHERELWFTAFTSTQVTSRPPGSIN